MLDGVLRHLQEPTVNEDVWLHLLGQNLQYQLNNSEPSQWPTLLDSLELPFHYTLHTSQAIQIDPSADMSDVDIIYDHSDEANLYVRLNRHHSFITFGPLPDHTSVDTFPTIIRWIPAIFYGAIFVLVAVWIRPLLIDIERLNKALQQFSDNYQSPLPELKNRSALTGLATSIDSMASKIRSLINLQKELTGVLSHELRTPLARIHFSIALLKNELGNHNELHAIKQDIQDIDELLDTILNFTKLDQPDVPVNPQSIPAKEWMDDIIHKFKRTATFTKKSINISVNIPDKIKFFADPTLLSLAANNLIANAGRHTKTRINISIGKKNSQFIYLSVEDDGEGVMTEDQQIIFEPFKRSGNKEYVSKQNTIGDEGRGYGLGLAIVKRVITLHKGKISVQPSADLGGALFTLSIPTEEKQL
ncbi:hypothetical protein GCM10007877_37350 [Marinibactrum halimedae]|uniref:histidine kinase n=1 Tax=Marinibactrum halimedae TaxID=1444977 RepID=A0AA37TCT8_9GAMM|nr:hypothetical protein GCM10007877_37350 [Marinibactrum halimedae]